MQDSAPFLATNQHLKVHVSLPEVLEPLVTRCKRLDVYSAPTGIVKQLRDRFFDGVIRTHINVEAVAYAAEGTPKDNIFPVLRV
jgi:hypothetical protein